MKRFAGGLALALILPWSGRAEDPALPTKFYTLNFVVQEVDGTKLVDSREYSAIAATNAPLDCSIRAGSQMTLGPVSQQHVFDVGVNLDISHLEDGENNLTLIVKASVSSLPADVPPNALQVMRNNSWSGTVLIPIKKPTVIFSSDDVRSKHKMQLVLTATPIK